MDDDETKTVVLDTNFLLIPHQFKINVMAELDKLVDTAHELVVGEPIVAEVRGLASGRGKAGIAARVALEAIRRNKIKVIPSPLTDGDEWIVEYCKAHPKTIVCTNDLELRRRLKAEGTGTRIIVMRTRTKIFWA